MRVEAPPHSWVNSQKHHLHSPCWYIAKKADINYLFLLKKTVIKEEKQSLCVN